MIRKNDIEEKLQKLYFGRYNVHFDCKSRLAIPVEFRKTVIERSDASIVFLSRAKRNDAPYIAVYDAELFIQKSEKSPELLSGECPKLSWDNQGRIVLPDLLREHAQITDYAAAVFGAHAFNHFEIWAVKNCERYGHILKDHSA